MAAVGGARAVDNRVLKVVVLQWVTTDPVEPVEVVVNFVVGLAVADVVDPSIPVDQGLDHLVPCLVIGASHLASFVSITDLF